MKRGKWYGIYEGAFFVSAIATAVLFMVDVRLGILFALVSSGMGVELWRAAKRQRAIESKKTVSSVDDSKAAAVKTDAQRAREAEFFSLFRIRKIPKPGTREFAEAQRAVDETLGRIPMYHKYCHAREVAEHMGFKVYPDRHGDYTRYVNVNLDTVVTG